jgi:hypothetical protein
MPGKSWRVMIELIPASMPLAVKHPAAGLQRSLIVEISLLALFRWLSRKSPEVK